MISRPGRSDDFYRERNALIAQDERLKDLELDPERLERERASLPQGFDQALALANSYDRALRDVNSNFKRIYRDPTLAVGTQRDAAREQQVERVRLQQEALTQIRGALSQ